MDRIIKFRGFNEKQDKWLYGYYLVNGGKHYIIEDESDNGDFVLSEDFIVEADSVGQFTGLRDSSGWELYEGDMISNRMSAFIVEHNNENNCFVATTFKEPTKKFRLLQYWLNDSETVAVDNIFENPKILAFHNNGK